MLTNALTYGIFRVFFSTKRTEHTLLTLILIVVWRTFLVFFIDSTKRLVKLFYPNPPRKGTDIKGVELPS